MSEMLGQRDEDNMSKTIDAEEFLTWLDEAEEELKSARRKDDQTDKRDEGILAALGIIREYVEKMCKVDAEEEKR